MLQHKETFSLTLICGFEELYFANIYSGDWVCPEVFIVGNIKSTLTSYK